MAYDADRKMGDVCTPEMYSKARGILVSAQSVSVSLLQRQMKIGYGVALMLMDELERSGVVTPLNENGCRMLMFPYRITTQSKVAGDA